MTEEVVRPAADPDARADVGVDAELCAAVDAIGCAFATPKRKEATRAQRINLFFFM
jgi:hypothetical protein